jgi:hypothetical protein
VFICETTPTGRPRSRPRVSLSIYLSTVNVKRQPLFTLPETVPAPFSETVHGTRLNRFRG